MKTRNKIIPRIIALVLAVVSIFCIAAVPASAAAYSKYSTTIYNTSSYKQISTSTAILKTQPRLWLGSTYVTLSKNALIKTSGTVKSDGKTWYKVKIDTTTYYVQSTSVKSAASKTTAYLYKVTKNNAPLRATPYESGACIEKVPQNTLLRVVGEVKNKHGNVWFEVIDQGSSEIRYMYSGNVTANYSNSGDIRLDQSVYFQTTNYTCSAASTLSVLRYANLSTSVSDQTAYKSIQGYVYKTVNYLNSVMGANTYKYNTFKSQSSYENAIRTSLSQGCAVIARVKFTKQYFSYSSGGHYTTIVGIYKKNGETWLELKDSFVNRYASNSYSNKSNGTVHIPLKTLYNYGTYGGTSYIYLIYNP